MTNGEPNEGSQIAASETHQDSGRYPVSEVNGRRPEGLDEFVGSASFTVVKDGMSYRVVGTGRRSDGTIRFQQQHLGGNGQDIRAWAISDAGDHIVAEPAIAF